MLFSVEGVKCGGKILSLLLLLLQVSDFIVENSADTPVLIQVLPLSLYPNPGTIIDLTSQGYVFPADITAVDWL